MGLTLVDVIASGILTGGIYGLLAIGISIILGVMRVINFAHGEFIMLAMYMAWILSFFGFDPLMSLPVTLAFFIVFGMAVYFILIRRVVEVQPMTQVLLTYGLSLLLANTAMVIWKGDFRSIATPYLGRTWDLGIATISVPFTIACALSIGMMVGLGLFLSKTKVGTAMRGIAQDVEAARLMGINVERMRAFTFGIGIGFAGAAGALMTIVLPYIYPYISLPLTIKAFIVTVLGGMGSIQGALLGGLLLGLVESLGSLYFPTGYREVWGLVIFLLILRLRPSGLMGRVRF